MTESLDTFSLKSFAFNVYFKLLKLFGCHYVIQMVIENPGKLAKLECQIALQILGAIMIGDVLLVTIKQGWNGDDDMAIFDKP